MFAFSFIRRHILKLPCTKISPGIISESGVGCWYRPLRMDENPVKCLMCGVNYHSEADRLRHLQGKRHKGNFDKDLGVLHKSVEVRWDSKWLESDILQDYISRFGKIEKFYCNPFKNYAFVYFNNPGIVNKLVRKEDHSINGISIDFKKRIGGLQRSGTLKPKPEFVEVGVKDFSHYKLMTELLKLDTMSEQMKAIKETTRLTTSEMQARENVVESLTKLFRNYIPACSIHLFGSSENGFGMKGCDIDLYLDLHENEVNLAEQVVQLPPKFLMNKSNVFKEFNIYELTLKEKILFTGKVLRSNGSAYRNVFSIASARCPVVKFKDVLTGLECDISINNRLALRNTKLLALYASLDERVCDLVYTIRYWGKEHNLAGKLPTELTSYALTSLVIFFLQNTSPQVLPKLTTLRDLTDERVEMENWNCSFTDDISLIPKTTNTDTSGELFKKFLDFYEQVSFKKVLLKCDLATMVPINLREREKFSHPEFRFSVMNVQDPFVLKHNVTFNVNADKVVALKTCLTYSSNVIKKCWDSNRENMALICALDVSQTNPDTKDIVVKSEDTKLYSFPIDLKQEVTREDGGISDYLYCVHAYQFVEKLMSDILCIEMSVDQNNIISEKEFQSKIHHNSATDNSELTDIELETNFTSDETLLTKTEEETNMAAGTFARQVLANFDEISDNQNKRNLSQSEEHSAKRSKMDKDNQIPSTSSHFENASAPDVDESFHKTVLAENSNIETEATPSLEKDIETPGTSDQGENLTMEDIISDSISSESVSIDCGEIVYDCRVDNIPLNGRQKVGKEIRMQQVIQDLELEKEISKNIMERGDHSYIKLNFKCILKPSISESHTQLNVTFKQSTDQKSSKFNYLCEFLKSYILKMFKKDLNNESENKKK